MWILFKENIHNQVAFWSVTVFTWFQLLQRNWCICSMWYWSIHTLLPLLPQKSKGLFYCPEHFRVNEYKDVLGCKLQLRPQQFVQLWQRGYESYSIDINSGSWCEVAKRALSYIVLIHCQYHSFIIGVDLEEGKIFSRLYEEKSILIYQSRHDPSICQLSTAICPPFLLGVFPVPQTSNTLEGTSRF